MTGNMADELGDDAPQDALVRIFVEDYAKYMAAQAAESEERVKLEDEERVKLEEEERAKSDAELRKRLSMPWWW